MESLGGGQNFGRLGIFVKKFSPGVVSGMHGRRDGDGHGRRPDADQHGGGRSGCQARTIRSQNGDVPACVGGKLKFAFEDALS